MRIRIQELLIVSVVVCLVLVALKALLTGYFTFGSVVEAAMWASPLLVGLMLCFGDVWAGVILGSTMLTFMLPLPILHRIEIGLVIICAVCGLVVLRRIVLGSGPPVFAAPESLAMKIAAALIVLRFAYDRPGSLRMGMTGGGGEAVVFVAGCFVYFMTAMLFSEQWNVRRNIGVVVGLGVLALAIHVGMTFPGASSFHCLSALFNRQSWFLCPLAFAYTSHLRRKHPGSLFVLIIHYSVFLGILMLGVFSIHRSRLLFSIGILLAVAYAYRNFKRTAAVVVAVMFLGITGALALNAGWLPPPVARALSTVLPSRVPDTHTLAVTHGISGEMGWTSPFRAALLEIAWQNIRQHPLVGKGFILTLSDFTYEHSEVGTVQRLAASGMYHNSIVELAVFCGLPVAIAFTLAYCIGVWRFARILHGTEDHRLHLLCASVLGFFVAASGQMLMNGGSRDFATICILLAVMRGICVRQENAPAPAEIGQPASCE